MRALVVIVVYNADNHPLAMPLASEEFIIPLSQLTEAWLREKKEDVVYGHANGSWGAIVHSVTVLPA